MITRPSEGIVQRNVDQRGEKGVAHLAHLVLGPPFIWAGAAEVQCGATRGTYGVRRPMIRLGGPKTDGMTFGLRRIAPTRRCQLRRVAYYFAQVHMLVVLLRRSPCEQQEPFDCLHRRRGPPA